MQSESILHGRVSEETAASAIIRGQAVLSTEARSHLHDCPMCRAEAAAHTGTAALLAFAVPVLGPTPELRQSILAIARAESLRQAPPPVLSADNRRPGWLAGLWQRRAVAGALAAAAAIVALVVGVAFAVETSRLSLALETERQARRSLETQVRANEAVFAELARPGFAVRDLQGTGPAVSASARLYLNPTSTTAVLAANGLQPAEAGRVYQLWLIKDGQRTSGGTFVTDQTGVGTLVIAAPLPLSAYQTVGVTIEPVGGSPGPTGPRVLAGSL